MVGSQDLILYLIQVQSLLFWSQAFFVPEELLTTYQTRNFVCV